MSTPSIQWDSPDISAEMDQKYEEMIQGVNEREDAIALAMWKWTRGLITEQGYENIVKSE